MNNILIMGFKGEKNSSKKLLDNIINNDYINTLFLDNDFSKSEHQLINKLKSKNYSTIYAFGQKPLIKSIYIEIFGSNKEERIVTNYDYSDIKNYLSNYYKTRISENAGNYLCNNIYYKGLKHVLKNNLETNMLFIHIPYLKNIDIIKFSEIFNKYLECLYNNR